MSDNLDETVTQDTTAVSVLADTLGSSDWYSWGDVTIGDDDVSNSLTFASLGSYAKICILQQTETMSDNGNDLLATETNADGTTTTLSYNNLNDQIETSVGLSGGSSTASYTAYDPLQRTTGTIDPDGNVSTYSYQLLNDPYSGGGPGVAVTTSQGPSAAVSSESATFNDLGQNPGNSRVYTVYAETSATIYSASIDATDGYDFPRRRFPPTFRARLPWGKTGTRSAR